MTLTNNDKARLAELVSFYRHKRCLHIVSDVVTGHVLRIAKDTLKACDVKAMPQLIDTLKALEAFRTIERRRRR